MFIFILMEFQSSYERMVLRLLEYMLKVYEEQIELDKRLSVVVPIVIYNGKEIWKEDTKFIRYFHLPDAELKRYIPAFEYILVDVNKIEDSLLESLKSEVSYFFLLMNR